MVKHPYYPNVELLLKFSVCGQRYGSVELGDFVLCEFVKLHRSKNILNVAAYEPSYY